MSGKPNGGVYSSINLSLYGYAGLTPLLLVDPDGNAPLYDPNNVMGGFEVNPNTGQWESLRYNPRHYDPNAASATLLAAVGAGGAAIVAPELIAACAGSQVCTASAVAFGTLDRLNSAADGMPSGGAGRAVVPSRGLSKHGGVLSSTTNASGGEVVTAVGKINQNDIAPYVNNGLYKGEVNVISGAHGSPSQMIPDANMFKEDVARFGNIPGVNVHDITKMKSSEITEMLNGPGTTIGGFCDSAACLKPFQ